MNIAGALCHRRFLCYNANMGDRGEESEYDICDAIAAAANV